MRFMIVQWIDGEPGYWKIVHYSHHLDDLENIGKKYPKDQGYKWMVGIDDLDAMRIMKLVQSIKAKAKEKDNGVNSSTTH